MQKKKEVYFSNLRDLSEPLLALVNEEFRPVDQVSINLQ